MYQRRQSFKSLNFPFVALALHGLDGDDGISLYWVASKDFSKGSFAQDAVRVEIEVVG